MNYLYFDIECCDGNHMCSFGYVITNENFESEVLNFKGKVIVDFYGTWCMPCKMLAPIVEKVANEN